MGSRTAFLDCRSLAVTAAEEVSARKLDHAITSYLYLRKDALQQVEALRAGDPQCVLAHCLAGYLHMHASKRDAYFRASEALLAAERVVVESCVTDREAQHVRALRAWWEGRLQDALSQWESILTEQPRDLTALKLAQFITSYLGNSIGTRDCVARILPEWNDSIPGYGFVLGCYAFGLEESGEYKAAERYGRIAVEMNPQDLWAAHAVGHVLEMQGRPREGIRWMSAVEHNWAECGNFVFHLHWHRGLYYLALGDYDGVLDWYDRRVRADSTDEYLDIANSASLLWRLEQAGINVGPRWEELAARSQAHVNDHFFVFADLHYLMAIAAAADFASADDFIRSCEIFSARADKTQSVVMKEVGLALARAIIAHRGGNYRDTSQKLLEIQTEIRRLGGSHAQRDTFEQMLIDSVLRSGEHALAHDLLLERTQRRPGDVWSWRMLASLCSIRGDLAGAGQATERLEFLIGTQDSSTVKAGVSAMRS